MLESLSVDSGKTALNDSDIKVYLTKVDGSSETKVFNSKTISSLETYSSAKKLHDGQFTFKNGEAAKTEKYRLRYWISNDVDASDWDTASEYQYKFRVNINAAPGVEIAAQNGPKSYLVDVDYENANSESDDYSEYVNVFLYNEQTNDYYLGMSDPTFLIKKKNINSDTLTDFIDPEYFWISTINKISDTSVLVGGDSFLNQYNISTGEQEKSIPSGIGISHSGDSISQLKIDHNGNYIANYVSGPTYIFDSNLNFISKTTINSNKCYGYSRCYINNFEDIDSQYIVVGKKQITSGSYPNQTYEYNGLIYFLNNDLSVSETEFNENVGAYYDILKIDVPVEEPTSTEFSLPVNAGIMGPYLYRNADGTYNEEALESDVKNFMISSGNFTEEYYDDITAAAGGFFKTLIADRNGLLDKDPDTGEMVLTGTVPSLQELMEGEDKLDTFGMLYYYILNIYESDTGISVDISESLFNTNKALWLSDVASDFEYTEEDLYTLEDDDDDDDSLLDNNYFLLGASSDLSKCIVERYGEWVNEYDCVNPENASFSYDGINILLVYLSYEDNVYKLKAVSITPDGDEEVTVIDTFNNSDYINYFATSGVTIQKTSDAFKVMLTIIFNNDDDIYYKQTIYSLTAE